MTALQKTPSSMTVAEFLTWNPPSAHLWQLVDGKPQAMAPASRTHGAIQNELGRLIGNHLAATGSGCSVVTAPGIVPRVQSRTNVRVPDLAVTCSAYAEEESVLGEPVLVIEILSPSNRAETWANVWTYASIPSVREILIVDGTAIAAAILRRNTDGFWPQEPENVMSGDLMLASIDFRMLLSSIYRTTRLAGER